MTKMIVELFAGGEGDGAKRFGFVGFAVAEEGPAQTSRSPTRLQATIFEVAHEARLVNRLNGTEAPIETVGHSCSVGHQPRM